MLVETLQAELRLAQERLRTLDAELRRTKSDFSNLVENTQLWALFLDGHLRVTGFTPALSEIVPLTEADIGRPLAQLESDLPLEALQEDARRVLNGLGAADRRIEDGPREATYAVRTFPCRDADGAVTGVIVTLADVSALSRSEHRQNQHLSEFQHRLRNSLAVMRSLVTRTAETSPSVEEYASHLQGRLGAFARTQAIVTRDTAAGVDLEYLVAEELQTYRAREGEQVGIEGPVIRLTAKAADTFGLAVHELATNAVKFGALSNGRGHIHVDWQVARDAPGAPRLAFHWRESGVTIASVGERRRGFGMELLERTLHYQLAAETLLAFEPTGLQCVIHMPLTEDVVVRIG
jgi:two-component system CheB/CheR fusion protein